MHGLMYMFPGSVMQRQFSRLVEMLQFRALDESDALALRAYRLQVKERLYRFNFVSVVVPACCQRGGHELILRLCCV